MPFALRMQSNARDFASLAPGFAHGLAAARSRSGVGVHRHQGLDRSTQFT